MNPVVKGGIILAVIVFLITVLIGATGMHKNAIVAGLVSIVIFIGITFGVVFWVLGQTAAESGYGKQVANALLVGVIAGALIFLLQWINLAVIFPNYLEEMGEGMIAMMESAGIPEAQMDAQIAKLEAATPVSQAATGAGFTVGTSLFFGLIVAIFKRRK